jgi:crossover junction endodeoxyribonuclease RusA
VIPAASWPIGIGLTGGVGDGQAGWVGLAADGVRRKGAGLRRQRSEVGRSGERLAFHLHRRLMRVAMSRPSRSAPRLTPPREPLFEFCVHARPASARTRNRAGLAAWQQTIRDAAVAAWPEGIAPLEAEIELRITHFGEKQFMDMDNLIKPIQDALQGIAYLDDRQVRDVTGRWRDIEGRYSLRYIAPCLVDAFSAGGEFVYIRLWIAREDVELD